MDQAWTEHQTCARCGIALQEEFRANHLGVRFCVTCYTEAVEVKAKARACEPWLHEACSRCGGSLINGYRANYMGIHYCAPCFLRTHDSDGYPLLKPSSNPDQEEDSSSYRAHSGEHTDWSLNEDEDEDEGIFLHDVFFVTTILALVMYALARFGGVLMSLAGY